jgi:molybdenum ABC transporter, periplasmic molybdate-binding protein
VRLRALAVAGVLLLLVGCGQGSGGSTGADSATLTVFAASSLRDTFTTIGEHFEATHPGTTVRFNFAGSSDLAQQIVQGAPADVFAAASDTTMKTVADAGRTATAPALFAKNALRIAVAPGNPKGIASFADLARPDLKVVVCAEGVPCGDAELKIEAVTGIDVQPVSEEPDVKSTLSKVQSGDADAGLVYVTDVAAAMGTVEGVAFPEAEQAVTDYPIAVVQDSGQAALAQEFVALVTGPAGQTVLQEAGFLAP